MEEKDLISRQDAVDYCKKMLIETALNNVSFICNADELLLDIEENRIETWLSHVPPAQPEQRKEILYRHYKGGIYELVCNNVTHTETGESLVIYRDYRGKLWARPESMFYGLVNVGDNLVPRFVLCRSEGDEE